MLGIRNDGLDGHSADSVKMHSPVPPLVVSMVKMSMVILACIEHAVEETTPQEMRDLFTLQPHHVAQSVTAQQLNALHEGQRNASDATHAHIQQLQQLPSCRGGHWSRTQTAL